MTPDTEEVIRLALKVYRYAKSDPETSLTYARKLAEAICRDIFITNPNARCPIIFDELIKKLEDARLLPKIILISVNTIRAFGNFGTHANQGLELIRSGQIETCLTAVDTLLKWYYEDHFNARMPEAFVGQRGQGSIDLLPVSEKRIRIATLEELAEWGWNDKEIVNGLIDLDYRTMIGLNEDHEGTSEQWLPLYSNHPDLWTILVDPPKTIVGYWHVVGLFDEDFKKAKQGLLLDKDITLEKIRVLELPGYYKLYFICISLSPKYRTTAGYNVLFNSIFEKFESLASQDIYVEEICANAFTREGQSLCKSIGMSYLCGHKDKGQVFAIDMIPLPSLRILRRFPELVKKYEEESALIRA